MPKRKGVLIGRFQGYHYSHHELLRKAALDNDLLVVIIGSRNSRVSIKNPFTAEQRIAMIERNIKDDPELNSCRIVFRAVNDHPDNKVWESSVKFYVRDFGGEDQHTTLYGCDKDMSTFYLHMFPEWKKCLIESDVEFNATDLRKVWFGSDQIVDNMLGHKFIPNATIDYLYRLPYNENLQGEWEYYQKEKILFSNYPFPETLTFCCGDAVVICRDHVLMIRRKNNPGKGCLALPGGFKNRNETFFDAAVRELYEETGIEFDWIQLKYAISGARMFDNPNRSIGIPRATFAVYFDITPWFSEEGFPNTKAADDAAEVVWMPIKELISATNIYDDHAAIVIQRPIPKEEAE